MSLLVFILQENVCLTVVPESSPPSLACQLYVTVTYPALPNTLHRLVPFFTLLNANLEKISSSPTCLHSLYSRTILVLSSHQPWAKCE